MPYKEKEIGRLYWSIGDLAGGFGVACSKIRYYETFLNLDIKRDRDGRRYYSVEDMEYFHMLVQLTKWGITVDRLLKLHNKGKVDAMMAAVKAVEKSRSGRYFGKKLAVEQGEGISNEQEAADPE